MSGTQKDQRRWWKDAVIYQVYPASFKDANGDGMGDIAGITEELEYIASIGATAVWLCPCYVSPLVDMGYDVSDYKSINPRHGSVQDIEALIDKAHSLNLKVLMDLVINHTSDQHEWFKESRSSRDSPKRDWYVWKDARLDAAGNKIPPTNWRSAFNEPAWSWDEATQQYYLHLFAKEQPDLNWENKDTRKAIYQDAIHFWLSKGIDGFRVDTVNLYSKGEYRDAPISDPSRPDQPGLPMAANGPRIHEFIREMHREAFAPYGDVMTVGELPCTSTKEGVLSYVRESDPQLSMVFQFDAVNLDMAKDPGRPRFEYDACTLQEYKKTWTHMQQLLAHTDGWSSVFFENHDQARSVSRFGSDSFQFWALSAKLLATQLACMTGTLFIYQGQEIGMVNVPEDWSLEEYIDIDSVNYIEYVRAEGSELEKAKHGLLKLARDHARIPMQWSDAPFAGFSPASSTKKPWMRVHDNYKSLNVAAQLEDKDSVLNYWRRVLKLRQQNIDLFAHGEYQCPDLEEPSVYRFTKTFAQQQALVVLNFSGDEQSLAEVDASLCCALSNYTAVEHHTTLRPWEARIYLSSSSKSTVA